MNKILLEICCGSADDCIEAARGGADRVELNSALFLGGLTPTAGTVRTVRSRADIPIIAMVRPRAGGFCYTPLEFETMEHDARELIAAGARGIAFGCLRPDGGIDVKRCARLTALAHQSGAEAVFHRAIDVVPDWQAALDALIALRIDRVLTSGQMPSAALGLDVIADMVKYAAGRIEILPASGINSKNIRAVIGATGCTQAHMSAKAPQRDPSCAGNGSIHFGGALYPPEDSFDMVDYKLVAALRACV